MLPLIPGAITGAKVLAGAAAKQALETGGRALMSTVINHVKRGTSITSLADLTKPARVEPLVIVDQQLVDQPIMLSVMKLAASSYAAYYLQAVNMILGVGRIDTLRVLDSLNPDRSLMGPSAASQARTPQVSKESYYSGGLPSLEMFNQSVPSNLLASMEADDSRPPSAMRVSKGNPQTEVDEEPKGKSTGDGSAVDAKILEVDNLIVGKLLNIEIEDGQSKGKLPVLIRMVPATVPSASLVHMFSAGGRDSWAHRMFMVKTGQIKFWRDYVFGMDMIDEHTKALLSDKSGVFKTINDRRRNNMKASMKSGVLSLADASNVAIISAETIKKAAGKLLGGIDDKAVRQTIFDNTYLLMLMTVDERRQRVTIWHRGMDLPSTYRFDEVERTEKAKGPDITDMFKMISRNMQTNIN